MVRLVRTMVGGRRRTVMVVVSVVQMWVMAVTQRDRSGDLLLLFYWWALTNFEKQSCATLFLGDFDSSESLSLLAVRPTLDDRVRRLKQNKQNVNKRSLVNVVFFTNLLQKLCFSRIGEHVSTFRLRDIVKHEWEDQAKRIRNRKKKEYLCPKKKVVWNVMRIRFYLHGHVHRTFENQERKPSIRPSVYCLGLGFEGLTTQNLYRQHPSAYEIVERKRDAAS